jgi:hypothetical protein
MTSAEAVQSELERLSHVLEAIQTQEYEEWSAEWLTVQSLLGRQADLFHELGLLEGSAQYQITLMGGAERGHEIDSDFLGQLLRALQGTVGAAVQSVMHGKSTRGRLPQVVLDASNLRVAPAAAGSFVLNLDGPPRAAAIPLDGGEPELPAFDEAMARVLDVMAAAERDERNPEQLLAAIAAIGSPRAIQHMSELTRALARTATTAVVVEHSPFSPEPREVRLPIMASHRLTELLSRTRQTSDIVFRTGRLAGLRWTRATFDLQIEHPAEGPDIPSHVEVITGSVITDIRDTVRPYFDTDVRAELQRTVSRSVDDHERVMWRLLSVEPAEAAQHNPE